MEPETTLTPRGKDGGKTGSSLLQKLGILNGFGRTIGDSLIGVQALKTALDLGQIRQAPILYRLPGFGPVIEGLYQAADFIEVRELPWSCAAREDIFEAEDPHLSLIDLRDFAHDPKFLCKSMIDYFLEKLGLDPVKIPSHRKRISWLADRLIPKAPQLPEDYILVCPAAACTLRTMPETIHQTILRTAKDYGPVVTQGVLHADLADIAEAIRPASSLEELCGLVASASWVISTDTAMIHLADAFSRPCLAFFPTHEPEWRVRDYPFCQSFSLMKNEIRGLEFARGEADLEIAKRAWLREGEDLSWLRNTLHDVLGALKCSSKLSATG